MTTSSDPRPGRTGGHTKTPPDVEGSLPPGPDSPAAPPRACMVGYARVPADLVAASLSGRARRLWEAIDIHQRDNDDAYPGREHLSDDLDCSISVIKRAVRELKDAGWLAVEHGGGRGQTNRYRALGRPPRKGVGSDPVYAKRGSVPTRERGSEPTPRSRGSEPEGRGHSSAQGATARVCELGRVIAADGSCCPEHDWGQVPRPKSAALLRTWAPGERSVTPWPVAGESS